MRPLPSFVKSYRPAAPITKPALVNSLRFRVSSFWLIAVNCPEQFVVPLRAVQQERSEDEELPLASDNANCFFHRAGDYRFGHSLILVDLGRCGVKMVAISY
jgi:hypothetical protein